MNSKIQENIKELLTTDILLYTDNVYINDTGDKTYREIGLMRDTSLIYNNINIEHIDRIYIDKLKYIILLFNGSLEIVNIDVKFGYVTLDFDDDKQSYILEYKGYDLNELRDMNNYDNIYPKISLSIVTDISENDEIIYSGKVHIQFQAYHLDDNVIFSFSDINLMRVSNELTNFVYDFNKSLMRQISLYEDGYYYNLLDDNLYKILDYMGEEISIECISDPVVLPSEIPYIELIYTNTMVLIPSDYFIVFKEQPFKDGELYSLSSVESEILKDLLTSNAIERYNDTIQNINYLIENSNKDLKDNLELINGNIEIYENLYEKLINNKLVKKYNNIIVINGIDSPIRGIGIDKINSVHKNIEIAKSFLKTIGDNQVDLSKFKDTTIN